MTLLPKVILVKRWHLAKIGPFKLQLSALKKTEDNQVQSLKAATPIVVTLFGIVIDVRPLHLLKAHSPIKVTLLGMVTADRPVQRSKALLAIEMTLLGMVTEVIPVHPSKAFIAIEVTEKVYPL